MRTTSTILIADDHLSGREVLRGLLSGEDYNLIFAENGTEALLRAQEIQPDLILLDVMMPDMDGFTVCQQLRTDPELSEVPVIMVTALEDQDSRVQGIEAGADDFITKPFDSMELLARVRTTTRLNRYRLLLQERVYRERAETEVYRRHREQLKLNQLLVTAASTFEIEEILFLACETLVQTFLVPQAMAMLLNETQSQFVKTVEYRDSSVGLGENGDEELLDCQELLPLVSQLSEYLSNYKVPLVISVEQVKPELSKVLDYMAEQGLGIVVVVPIMIGEKLVAMVELQGNEARYFDGYDLTLMESMGTAMGQALERAQLYQNLKVHAEQLEETVAERTYELQRERDRIEAILEALGEAVVVTDVAGTIEYLNPAALTLTGFTKEEAKGHNWRIWQSQKSRDRASNDSGNQLYDEITEAVKRGEIWQNEVNNKRKDGSLYDALLTVAPLLDSDKPDRTVGFVSVQTDITPFKEAERIQAIHQEREKQVALDRLRHTFLGTINHEMRTPLTLIFQGIEMLEEDYLGELTSEQLDAIMAIRRQSWTLGKMIESLTRVAAFLSKQETVRPVWGQLEPVLTEVLPLVEFKARSKEIAIETDLAPRLPAFPLDVKQMTEALTQLTDNAIKFNRAGGTVRINTRADENWVEIAVSDTGIGIEAELMNRIWEIFEQGVDPVRRAQEGLGLGLVLARYIVEAHNGLIVVETTPGRGSTFTIKLPRSQA